VSNPFVDAEVLIMPAEEYHARRELSRSDLVAILTDPQRWAKAPDKAPTAAMSRGTILHGLILEGPEWEARHLCVVPDGECLTAKGEIAKSPKSTGAWERAVAAAGGRLCLLASERETYRGAEEAALDAFGDALRDTDREVVILATHKASGIRLRCRLDAWARRAATPYVLDLKTAAEATPEAFGRTVGRYRLDIQAALYSDMAAAAMGLPELPFVFAVLEPEAPHMAGLYDLASEWVDAGRMGYEAAIAAWQTYEEDGWPMMYRGTLRPRPWEA